MVVTFMHAPIVSTHYETNLCTSYCIQNKQTPFSPTTAYPGSGSSERHPLQLRSDHRGSSDSRTSEDGEYSRQISEMSAGSNSVEGSLNDPALLKSLTKFQRSVYVSNSQQ